ncbi:MAG: tRNA (adenosine(37)-N6)-threonylcarbamoyltransferase complex ATPase subunit type 1 TsaE [Acidobacteriota bacterium]
MTRITLTSSEQETSALGRDLGPTLPIGTTLLLRGDLGAGKTAFVRGLAEGMGLPAEAVSSPTFTLIQEYRGARRLFHVDLYRISAMEADDLGLDELTTQGVVAIEWADKWTSPPASAIDVHIEDLGGDSRRVTIRTAE